MTVHSRPARFRLRPVLATAAAAALLLTGTAAASDATATPRPTADGFQLGVTHTQRSIDSWGDPAAVADAKRLLADLGPLQNQHLMGWGTSNPWPDPDSDARDWESLDARMALIDETGGTPVITLCTAPGWMKPGGGRDSDGDGEDDMDWAMEAPVAPEHFDDFARLAAETAQRYPQVRHFQVWNEFKGFWNEAENRWDYEGFTEFYNVVYTAVKEVRPDALIGGPYTPMVTYAEPGSHPSDISGEWGVLDRRPLDAIEYWLANNVGADFFTMDAAAQTSDGEWHPTTTAQVTDKFRTITEWVAARTDLPIWWSEFYAEVSPAHNGSTPAMMRAALAGMRDGGASVALWWQPECAESGNFPCLWTSVQQPGGGQPTEYTPVAEEFTPVMSTADYSWVDEFDGPAGSGPDPALWVQETGCNWGDTANKEDQCYTDGGHNAELDGQGNLVIHARAEEYTNQWGESASFTSARLKSTHTTGSGNIVVRAKMDGWQPGAWPAIWTLGQPEDVWPLHGEVDLMENGLNGSDWRPTYNVHTPTHRGGALFYADAPGFPADFDPAEFHEYELDWESGPDGWAALSIDGVWYATLPLDVPADSPATVLLNVAVGSWAGAPDPNLDFTMTVDYVRVV
ncbi:beta-glucanase (GH16 family) [Stackebrandtia albiflava]|uniref:Beta-glucanase (GH16 family) n=1 Tax=Stackebrandtia albiflava TaxID=406432 RepID=A0A562V1H2_9ACTN|nr:family 16 glycosylhydrolase [Stackebrandtia albiflava]TWJ11695.1 beta-glucanase (GH16 family) [Stackebrandtia albiflava]